MLILQIWFFTHRKLFWHLGKVSTPINGVEIESKRDPQNQLFSPLLSSFCNFDNGFLVSRKDGLHLHATINKMKFAIGYSFFPTIFRWILYIFLFSDILFFDHDPQHKCAAQVVCEITFWPRVANLSRFLILPSFFALNFGVSIFQGGWDDKR